MNVGARTDRPERSYQKLFWAAKNCTTDTAVTIPQRASLRERPYNVGYQYGKLRYRQPRISVLGASLHV
jgi:hypothetical protein